MKTELIQKIAITFELVGNSQLSEAATKVIILKLERFPDLAVSNALDRCQDECTGRLSLGDIIQRIDDGRPGPNEAWAIIPKGEQYSCVWTDEMRTAAGEVWDLMGDKVAARMAFIEAYKREVTNAKTANKPVEWSFSAGSDINHRKKTLVESVEKGRLLPEHANRIMPELESKTDVRMISDGRENKPNGDQLRQLLSQTVENMPEI